MQQKEKVWNPKSWWFAAYIGFFAGLIWGVVKVAEHALKLTTIVPGFLMEPFYKHAFLGTWRGYAIGLLSFIGFSIVASLLYRAALLKAKGPWAGIAYGAFWWLTLYILLGSSTGIVPPLGIVDWTSLLTDFCLFLLWGMFIGYSISIEFTDERGREISNPYA